MPDNIVVPWEKPNRVILILAVVASLALGYAIGVSLAFLRVETTQPAIAAPETDRVSENVVASVDDDPAWGPPGAPVTIIEFSDYQCPFCKRFRDETLDQLMARFEGKIRFVYRDFPIHQIHPNAQKAAEAAECADEQGKFWPMHDRLFAAQGEWAGVADAVALFKTYAIEIELDTARFGACLDGGAYEQEVTKDYQDGRALGITGTPTFFVNGRQVVGAVPLATFEKLLGEILDQPQSHDGSK